MTNKAPVHLTCAAISVGHVPMPALAMPCSVLLPVAPLGGVWALPPPGAGVPWGVLGDISAAQPPFSRVTEVCTFPCKGRPEEEARRLAALFVALQAFKYAPIREEDSLEGPLFGGGG